MIVFGVVECSAVRNNVDRNLVFSKVSLVTVRSVDTCNRDTERDSRNRSRNRCSKADRKATPREGWCGGGRVNRSAATRCVLVARGVGDSSPRLAVKTSPVVLFLFAFDSIRRLYSRVYRCPRNL